MHANDDGIHMEGNGHVVCHNTLSGFGDSLKIEETGARAVDFEGNDVNGAYDNGIELDQSSGNVPSYCGIASRTDTCRSAFSRSSAARRT